MKSPHVYADDLLSVAVALDDAARDTQGSAGDHRLRSLARRAKEKVRLYTIGTAISIAPEDAQLKASAEVSRIVHAKDVRNHLAQSLNDLDLSLADFGPLG